MEFDLGYFDDETCRLEPIQNPFGPKVLPMSPEQGVTHVPGKDLPKAGVPTGIRTRVLALKGPRPRPLDDGDPRGRSNLTTVAEVRRRFADVGCPMYWAPAPVIADEGRTSVPSAITPQADEGVAGHVS